VHTKWLKSTSATPRIRDPVGMAINKDSGRVFRDEVEVKDSAMDAVSSWCRDIRVGGYVGNGIDFEPPESLP
jgi:hypothetical protein